MLPYMLDRMQEVAQLLPGAWGAVEREGMQGCYLVADNGDELHVSTGWDHPIRLEISGRLTPPRHDVSSIGLNHRERTITVAAAREPKAIARDIERRLLPVYAEHQREWQGRVARYDHAKACQRAYVADMADALGQLAPEESNVLRIYHGNGSSVWGDFTVSSDGTVSIDLRSVPIETATKIAALVV